MAEPVQFGGAVEATVAKPRTPTRLSHGRHGAAIAAVFPTEDGSAAVTIDDLHHARLWPAVDGSREPWAVPLTTPMRVTLAKSGDGFSLASLDVSGGLEVVAITNAGELTHRVKTDPDPGFEEVIAVGDRFLALRRDQTLVQIDHRGAETGVLMPRPGDHVVKLLARNGRVLALVRRKDGLRGRWVSDKLAWGEETAKLGKVDTRAVHLSPDGTRLVTFRIEQEEFFDEFSSGAPLGKNFVIDLESGRAKQIADPLSGQAPDGVPLGFTQANELVFLFSDFELSDIEWWTLKGHTRSILGGTNYKLEFVTVATATLTDNGVFMAAQQELVVGKSHDHTPSSVQYLGYRTHRGSRLRSTPGGVVAHAGGAEVLLGEHAQTARKMNVQDLVAIDRDLALVRTGPIKPKPPQESTRPEPVHLDASWFESPLPAHLLKRYKPPPPKDGFGLVDLATKQTLQHWPIARAFDYEPATKLLAVQRGSQLSFARFDAVARKFGDMQKLAAPVTRVALLDPALAGGKLAVLARESAKHVEVRALASLDAPLPEPVKLTGKLEAIDRAGRIYLREDEATIAIHAGAAEPVRLTDLKGWQIRASATGHVAAFGRSRITLFDAKGATLWSVALLGVKDVAWTQTGELFALGGDVVKLDTATGDIIAAQCGWSFGLRTYGPQFEDFPSARETACDR